MQIALTDASPKGIHPLPFEDLSACHYSLAFHFHSQFQVAHATHPRQACQAYISSFFTSLTRGDCVGKSRFLDRSQGCDC